MDVPDSHKLKALLESCNLRQSVNNTTHVHGHILDLILSPSDQDVCVHVDICEFISDHAVIKCAIDFPSSLPTCQTRISYRRNHCINISDFRSDLKEMPFVKSPANSVSWLYDQYVHDLSRILDRHVPLVSSLKTKQRADWLSKTYRLAKSLRHQFECARRKDKSQFNSSHLQRQIAWSNRLANRDKTVYYRKLISDNSHDSTKLWRELHKVLHRSHGTTLPTCESSKSLANRFATFFSNKIMKICESFSSSESCNTVHPPFDPPKLTVFTQVTKDEIGKIISKSPTKSCLLDPLPTFLIKECIDILLPSITKLVNFSLREGLVPDGFKKAVVTPLIKKASLPVEDLKNYRPVSGLSFISNLVECVVAKQLVDHIHHDGLDNSYQSSYKSGHSTETALPSTKNDIHLSLSRGEATALVLLDLSAAFDTIDHSTLLSCLLDWFGVGGSALKWFSSYLTERYQSVKIGSTLSDLQKLLFGVPQGSVLGPLLFSLYTSPLSTLIGKHKGVNFHFYADDTQLYVHLSHMNASPAFDKLNRCLQDVKEWMSASKLKLNPDKTEFILFGSKKQRESLNACFPIDILGNPLHPTESVRNLGVWFDSDFSFSKHVQNVCKGCFSQLRDFRNIRQLLTQDAAVSVANAFVSSRLAYCNSLFRNLSKVNLHRLQSIRNSAARIVTNLCKYTRITLILWKLHWLPIQSGLEFKLATLVYKFIHTGFPKYFAPHLSTYCTTYNTRRSQSVANFLNVPKFQPTIHKSTKQFGFNFAFDAPTVWNSLPEDIRASPTIASFRKKLKTYLHAKAYPP